MEALLEKRWNGENLTKLPKFGQLKLYLSEKSQKILNIFISNE